MIHNTNYENFLLAVSSLFLATSLACFIFISTMPQDLKTSVPLKNNFHFKRSELQKARQQVVCTEIGRGGSLFATYPYVWKEGKLIDPFENLEKLHPPIPNWWLIKYHLEYWKPDLLQTDLKGDGFTVLENYHTNTHPTALDTHAPLHIKLRFQEYISIPFRVKFTGTPDDGNTFALNARDLPLEGTQFLKLGESFWIRNIPYTLTHYSKKVYVNKDGLEIDASELTIEGNKEKIVFYLDQERDFPDCYGVFKFFEEEIKIKKGEIFTLQREAQYRLINVEETHAIIEIIATGEKYKILK